MMIMGKGFKLLSLLAMLSFIATAFLVVAPERAAAASGYYVDCSATTNGSGTQASPWNSLTTASAHTFTAGDQLLFKKGTSCNGQLKPSGNGASGNPVVVDAYGTGATPILNGGGVEATIHLLNLNYWTVQNLEVTNNTSAEAWRSGVMAEATDNNTHYGITFRNLHVHDVKGLSDRNAHGRYSSAGILVRVPLDTGTATGTFQNVTIENNNVHDVTCMGIASSAGDWGGFPRNYIGSLVVQNNSIVRAQADAIYIGAANAPLIQYNVGYDSGFTAVNVGVIAQMWSSAAISPTYQYNEAARIVLTNDSQAWDCDWGVSGTCTYQYNYSHDNSGGFFLNCAGCVSTGATQTQVLRYNINQGSSRLVNAGQGTKQYVYNNVFYSPNYSLSNMSFTNNSEVYNNIFVGSSSSSLPQVSGTVYDYNIYHGFTGPTDAHKSNANPLFVNAGSGGDGRATADGYKLRTGSPALATGKVISSNGGLDFWGNAVSATASPNRGAYNGAAVSSSPTWDSTGYYKMISRSVNVAIDGGGSVASGSNAKLWTSSDTSPNLQWQVVSAGSGYYKIINRTNGLALDSAGGASGSVVVQSTASGTSNNLQWQLVEQTGGYFKVINRGTGLALDSGGAASGSWLKQWTASNSSNNLQWTIFRIKD